LFFHVIEAVLLLCFILLYVNNVSYFIIQSFMEVKTVCFLNCCFCRINYYQ